MKNWKFVLAPAALMMMSSMILSAAVQLDGDLTPVPEPASVIMMGAGLAGVAFMGWKRNRKK
jgi:hypothetical protein